MTKLSMADAPIRATNAAQSALPQARMHVYAQGTTNPVSLFSNASKTVALSNPVTADGYGLLPDVYAPSAGAYTVRIEDQNGALVYQTDFSTEVATSTEITAALSDVAAVEARVNVAQTAAETARSGAETAETNAANSAVSAASNATAALTAAIAAGADTYVDASAMEAATSDGDLGFIPGEAGTALYKNVSGTATFQHWLTRPQFDTPSAFLASSLTGFVAGDFVYAGSVQYKIAASGASDHHVTTAGGVKAYVQPVYSDMPTYPAEAFGIVDTITGTALADKFTAALAAMPPYSRLSVPEGDYLLNRATSGAVLPSSSTINSGVTGAIYLDKDGQQIVGAGYGTHLNGQENNTYLVVVRAFYCRVSGLRMGNIKGQLTTGEASGVCYEPSNYPRVNPNGQDIEYLTVENCHFYQCEAGITAHPEAWGDLSAGHTFPTDPFTDYYLAKKLVVRNCNMVAMYRHAVEIAQTHDTLIEGCRFEIGPLSGELTSTTQRAVRVIGSRRVMIADTQFKTSSGHTLTNSVRGVETSHIGFYGVSGRSEMATDVQVSGCRFENFVQDITVEGVYGTLKVTDCISRKASTAAHHFVFVSGSGTVFNADYKIRATNIAVENCDAMGAYCFLELQGATDILTIDNNRFVSGDNTNPRFVILAPLTNADPDVAALERVKFTSISGNKSFVKPSALTPVLVSNFKDDDVVRVSDNMWTPSTSGKFLAISGANDFTVHADKESNIVLGATAWADAFNPIENDLTDGAF